MNPAPDERLDAEAVYAGWLEAGTRIAFAFSVVALLLYFGGVLPPFVPLEELPRLWTYPVGTYLARTHAPSGSDWFGDLRYGDYLSLAGICLFALLSLVCYARALPAFLRRGERLQAALAAAQIVVLIAAASNLVPGAR